jgi:soluble lytic murein transglycosylase
MTAMHKTLYRLLLLLTSSSIALLGCNLPNVVGLGNTPTLTITPTSTITPTITPSPTLIPRVLLETASWELFKGNWEQALSEYHLALAQAIDLNEQAEAQLGIGATLLRARRYQEAINALDLYLSSYPHHDRFGQAYFLRAQAYQALEQYQTAAQDYQQYLVHRPGKINVYVLELGGDAFYAAGDYPSAIAAYQDALTILQLTDGLALEIKIARAYYASGDYSTALNKYTDIFNRTDSDYTKAQMDFLRGQIFTILGQVEQAYDLYLHAVENYPLSYDTYIGLVELVEAGVPVNELDRGLVDYFAGQYGVALAAFNRYLNSLPVEHDGTVHHYKALTLRELGEYPAAINEWDLLIETHPGDRFWDRAWEEKSYTLWAYMDQYDLAVQTLLEFVAEAPDQARAAEFLNDAALIAERSNQVERAAQIWERLGDEYPDSEWTYRGLFLAGISRYRLNDFDGSRTIFQSALGIISEPADRAAVYLWIGKSDQSQGNTESAQAAWRLAAEADPNGYYSLRAKDLLAVRDPFQPLGVFSFITDLEAERLEAEQWMRDNFPISGTEPLSELGSSLSEDPRMIRGEELWQLGLYDDAKIEFQALRMEVEYDAEAVYRLMHKFIDIGLYQSALYSVRQLLNLAGMDDASIWAVPIYLSHVRFAPYFGELILPEALHHGMDGLFLLSVIRQESLFEGFATSYADARGLMQIIPSTGQYLADQLGWPQGYTVDDLYRPEVSVRLGSHYLAAQRDLFDGDLFASLAAYNAGPGNALKWKELAPEDPDLFLEVIRFRQTRDYIRAIYWAYAHYCELYIRP